MATSPHQIILTTSADGPITAYDAATGATLARFSGSRSPRHGLAFAGNSLIAASHVSSRTTSASINLYCWWSSTPMHKILMPEPVAPVAASPDGTHLFAGGISGRIYSFTIPSGKFVRSYSPHSGPVSCLVISSDGSLVISGGDDGIISLVPIFPLLESLSIYEDDEGPAIDLFLQRFVAHDGSVTSISTSAGIFDDSIITSCSADGTVKLWRLIDGGTNLRTIRFPCAIIAAALIGTEQREVYAGGTDGFVYRAPIDRAKQVFVSPTKHNSSVVSLGVVREGRNLASAAEDGGIFIWDVGGDGFVFVTDIGDEMQRISEMVVIEENREMERCKYDDDGYESNYTDESSSEEVGPSWVASAGLEEALRVAVRDRGGAIDMLEAAIGMYERLLELILKEAKQRGRG